MVFDGTSTLTEEKKVKTEWAVSIGRQEGGSCIVHMHFFKGYVCGRPIRMTDRLQS